MPLVYSLQHLGAMDAGVQPALPSWCSCVHTNTFPFCQITIWFPLKNEKELEALLSHLSMAVVTVQRELCAAG